MRLYDYAASGNCYKVRLRSRSSGCRTSGSPSTSSPATPSPTSYAPHESAAHHAGARDSTDEEPLPESAAILLHLAEGDPAAAGRSGERAQVVRWLVFEQTDVIPAVAGLRFRLQTGRLQPGRRRHRRGGRAGRGGPGAPRGAPRHARLRRRDGLLDRRHRSVRLRARRPRGRLRRRRHRCCSWLERVEAHAWLHERPRAVPGERPPRSRPLDIRHGRRANSAATAVWAQCRREVFVRQGCISAIRVRAALLAAPAALRHAQAAR